MCLYEAQILHVGERLQDHWSSGLAHLSRRLTGELLVYTGLWHPSVRRLSTFSNDISPQAVRLILSILHI